MKLLLASVMLMVGCGPASPEDTSFKSIIDSIDALGRSCVENQFGAADGVIGGMLEGIADRDGNSTMTVRDVRKWLTAIKDAIDKQKRAKMAEMDKPK